MVIEIKNAVIDSATIMIEDHGYLTAYINFDYGGIRQSMGGYALYSVSKEINEVQKANYAGLFIRRVLDIAGVEDWEQLKGVCVRVECDNSKVYRIGHILKDEWFDPSTEIEMLKVIVTGKREQI